VRVVIVGAGSAGTQLAKYLIQEKHDIAIIESNEEKAKQASNRLDCLVIQDEGSNVSALEEAGIAKADALICVTDSDEVNMIICGLAASHSGDRGSGNLLKIARVRNDDYARLKRPGEKQVLGIDHFIHPNMEMARSIIKVIERGVIGDILSFSNTPYELASVEIAEGSAMDGLELPNYKNLVNADSLIALVERENGVLLPSGATVLKKDDRVYILASSKDIQRIFLLAGNTNKPIRKIGIVGGGRIGILIAEGLLNKDSAASTPVKNIGKGLKKLFFPLLKTLTPKSSRRIIIIEQDSRLCKDLAARFPDALVLNEDISDESFVNDEQLNDLDCLITTTSNQELNIITAVYLKSKGVARTIAMVAGSGYAAMARQLGVDVVVPMKSVVVDTILSHLMGKGIKEVRTLGDGNVDLIEMVVGKNAPAVGKPISSFRRSIDGLLALVMRGNISFIPGGGYVFNEGDRIVLIVKTGSQSDIEAFFGTNP
jgi:trk system potassium uptake protein TrkA